VPYLQGLPLLPLLPLLPPVAGGGPTGGPSSHTKIGAVRGELIMRTDSSAVPPGKLARNIVAGALNRKEPDPALFAEIRFVAYELVYPSTVVPSQAYREMRLAGLEVARSVVVPAADMSEAKLSDVFGKAEARPQRRMGVVLAGGTSPEQARERADRAAAQIAVVKGA
jgi:hypothetical protein